MTGQPVLFVVEDDAATLERIREELERRYARDYRVECERSALAALERLQSMRGAGENVAVVVPSRNRSYQQHGFGDGFIFSG